ncbi:MAG: NAD(+)/NADH kinase [bacterium]|nr:NAD(+)/NADH kinase [bacterium]
MDGSVSLTGTAPQNPEDILTTVENGNFEIEDRMAIECFLSNGISSVALNDVVVSREAIARLIEIEVNINDEYLTTYVADGLIIATPTGSTAHSLSAGGPIVSPNAKGILLTPLCPHTLTNRPLIVDPTSVIRISLKSSTKDGLITIDGQQVYTVNQNDCVIIKVAPHPIKLVTLRARSYYEILRQKLNWGRTIMRFNVDKNKCKGCSLCVRVCPTKTLRMGTELNDYGNTYVECIDQSKCIACCMCATMCPD